jgi:uncharacterized damage-inducible protein DinB
MDLLDRLVGHDIWTTRQLLDICRGLSDEQLDRPIDIGPQTVRLTLRHIIYNIEAWSDLMAGRPMRNNPPLEEASIAALSERLDLAAIEFTRIARDVADRGAWDEKWLNRRDDPPKELSYGGTIAHVITHSMHHRAQLLYMLRLLGVENRPEGDVLSWEEWRSTAK